MRNILFVSDQTLKDIGPISDILRVLLRTPSFCGSKKFVVEPRTDIFNELIIEEIEGYKHFLTKGSYDNFLQYEKSLRKKLRYIFYKGLNKLGIKKTATWFIDYLDRVRKLFKFDLVIFIVVSPKIQVTRWLKRLGINYIFFLPDTWIDNPKYNVLDVFPVENEIISNSIAYYVPRFFYRKYEEVYASKKVFAYDLPLLLDKKTISKVLDCTLTDNEHMKFSYFGALQSFRNSKKIFDLFELLNMKLNVFCYDDFEMHPAVIKHDAEKGEAFYLALASSDFLVIFDNSTPYSHYLPSKVYPYVSFTKPILVFGDNKESALRDFLNDYPYYYYQDINTQLSSIPGGVLVHFLKSIQIGNMHLMRILIINLDDSCRKIFMK